MLLKELNDKELAELYNDNKWLMEQIDNQAWERASFDQAEEFKLIGAECFDYHDHYSSFYLSCPTISGAKSPEKLVGKLNAEYMSDDSKKLYAELCELNDKMEDAEEWDETRPEYDRMREIADELADNITAQLRAYEDMDYFIECKDMVLDDIREDNNWLSDMEVENGKIKQVIYH